MPQIGADGVSVGLAHRIARIADSHDQ